MRKLYRKFIFFFPIALVIIHFKRNHLLLLFWLLLFGIITKNIGSFYGMHHLFLAPEYLGEINYVSYGIIGLMVGSFIVAFNIYSYQLNVLVFPFMATVAKPFIKYTYNNSIIPLSFIATYLYNSAKFQYFDELIPVEEIILNLFGFLSGILIFIIIAYIYFLRFDKNIYKISGLTEEELGQYKTSYDKPIDGLLQNKIWERRLKRIGPWKIESYLSKPFKISRARSSSHYNRLLIKLFFTRNHVNASIFELGVITTFISLGLLRETSVFMIPAGASILVLFSLVLMLVNTFYSFFKRWSLSVLIITVIAINLISSQYDIFKFKSYAYGLNYSTSKAPYTEENIYNLSTDEEAYKNDLNQAKKTLFNWRRKTGKYKPKLIVINSSGGGSRSAFWTYSTIAYLDSIFNGDISSQIQFMSGASGGMIGASYYREMYWKSKNDTSIDFRDAIYLENIAKDILNPVSFSAATADLMPRFQEYIDGKYIYTKDRGYIFEKTMNENLNKSLNKRLKDYTKAEQNGEIPVIVYSPTIAHQNRRLLISSQPISYLTYKGKEEKLGYSPTVENIEFSKLFKDQDALNMRISSAIRMSATFPYILPLTHLPSEPKIEVMDAGGRDNIGVKVSYRYLFELREWINRYTSGVIIINIRDTENKMRNKLQNTSIESAILTPGTLPYQNFFGVQDFVNDSEFKLLAPYFNSIHQINFSVRQDKKVSLSMHLTKKDKQTLSKEIFSEINQESIKKLKEILE